MGMISGSMPAERERRGMRISAICAIRILRKSGAQDMWLSAMLADHHLTPDLLKVWIVRTKFLPRVTYGKNYQLISVDSVDHTKVSVNHFSQIDPLRFRYVAAAFRMSLQAPYRSEE